MSSQDDLFGGGGRLLRLVGVDAGSELILTLDAI